MFYITLETSGHIHFWTGSKFSTAYHERATFMSRGRAYTELLRVREMVPFLEANPARYRSALSIVDTYED